LACSFTLPVIIEYYLQHCDGEIAQALMVRVKHMLAKLDLPRHIKSYLTKEDLLSLKDKMFHPDRVGNYSGVINIKILDQLLSAHH